MTRDPKDYILSAGLGGRHKNITDVSIEQLQRHYMDAVDTIEDLDKQLEDLAAQVKLLQGRINRWRFNP